VLKVEDWAEIRRLHRAEGQPIKVIARVMGISKNTVKAALASDGPPAYRRRPLVAICRQVGRSRYRLRLEWIIEFPRPCSWADLD
jgi:transposase